MRTTPVTVGDFVRLGARRHPARAALRDRAGREIDYATLDDRTNRLASALTGLGLSAGDRIATWMSDSFEYVEVVLAVAKAGLVLSPLNTRLAAPEAVHQLGDAEARALIWTADLVDTVAELDVGVWDHVTGVAVGSSSGPAALAYEDLLADSAATLAGPSPAQSDLLLLGYTSGTTGRPKGAMLTHQAIVSIARQNAGAFRLAAYPEWILTGSMAFVSVIPAHVLSALSMGGTVTIMGRWDPESLIDTVRRHRGNFLYIPSPLLRDVTTALDRDRDALASVTSVLHSASRAHPEDLAELQAVVGTRLVEGWGMTEHSGGLATATSANDYIGVHAGSDIFSSVGRPVLDVEVRVVDADGAELPRDGSSVGELLIASPSLMSGYWKRPDATAEALSDGWYRTGDLGTISSSGYVSVSERRTDLIVSGGANVYPSEVERVIREISGVREVAVVGAPHPRWGQCVIAAVVPQRDGAISEEQIIEHCRRELAGYKKPTRVFFFSELPMTTSLKVARMELRDRVGELVLQRGLDPE